MVWPIRKNKPKPKPKIEYPPVPRKKWIPPDQLPKPPKPQGYVKPEGITQKLKYSNLEKKWHQFKVLKNMSVLVGSHCQTDKRYGNKTNGKQSAPNCMVAIAFSKIYPMAAWQANYIDKILQVGDKLCWESLFATGKKCEIKMSEVNRTFYIDDNMIQMEVEKKMKGNMFPTVKDPYAFNIIFPKFFENFQSGILKTQRRYFAFWKKDGAYFIFDPTEHEIDGSNWMGIYLRGYAVCLRFTDSENLMEWIGDNLNKKNNSKFTLYPINILRMVKINTLPPENLDELKPKPSDPNLYVETSAEDEVKKKSEVIVEMKTTDQPDSDSTKEIGEMEEFSPEIEIPEPVVTDEETDQEAEPELPEYLIDVRLVPRPAVSKSRIPPERPHTTELHYYKELMPSRLGILRGSVHQGNRRLFGHSAGKQGPANAMAAHVMRRLHKSREWVPKVVDDILTLGQKIYDEFKVSVAQAEQSCKVRDLPKKIEWEDKVYQPDVVELAVVGQLKTKKDGILNLEQALTEFFAENDGGILCGPNYAAVWLEDGFFYLYDPNERGETGLVIPKGQQVAVAKPSSSTLGIEQKREHGAACVMWFSDLKDLAEVYINNVQPHLRREPFYISRIVMNDYIELPDPWYNFKGISPGKWILRGTFNQNSKRFSPESRNTQCTAMATIALAYSNIKPEEQWTRDTVDEVTISGDTLYNSCVAYLRACNKFYDPMLLVDEIQKQFTLGDKEVLLDVEDCLVNGMVGAKNTDDVLNLRKGFEEFFKDNSTGMLTARSISVAVWKKNGTYFYYDSHSRDENGRIGDFGTACVLRIVDLDELAKSVEANFGPGSEDLFNISRVGLRICERTEDGKIKTDFRNYEELDAGSAILKSQYHMGSPIFEYNRNKQAIPMCLTAAGMAKVITAAAWNRDILDEILRLGDEYFTQTAIEIEKHPEIYDKPDATKEFPEDVEEEAADVSEGVQEEIPSGPVMVPVTLENVLKTFKIGINKFDVSADESKEGVFENELREALENHFIPDPCGLSDSDDQREVILLADNMSMVLWRDQGIYYLFDPNPRDSSGNIFGRDEWSQLGQPLFPEDVYEEEEELMGDEGIEEEELEAGEWGGEELPESPDKELDVLVEQEGSEMLYGEEEHIEDEIVDEEELERQRQQLLEAKRLAKLEKLKYWAEQAEIYGKSCVKLFTDMDGLIEHIIENVPPLRRDELKFKLYPLKIINTPELKDVFDPKVCDRPDVYAGNWHGFREIEHGRWILRGTMNLCNRMYPEPNRGKQYIPMCFAALGFAALYNLTKYQPETVDMILQYGDRLYTYTRRERVRMLKSSKDVNLSDEEIADIVNNEIYGLDDIVKKFSINDSQIEITEIDAKVKGDVKAGDDNEQVLGVAKGLEKYFELYQKYGILHAKDVWVAIWRSQKTYYMFDPYSRGPSGFKVPDDAACITRYLDLSKMADVFLKNLNPEGNNAFVIYQVSLKTGPFERPRPAEPVEDMEVLPTSTFTPVSQGKSVLRGTIHQDHPTFKRAKDVASAPIAIVALAMSLVHKPKSWSKPIIDEIIRTGDGLYDISAETLSFEFNPWEQRLTPHLVCNDFNLGLLRVNFELTDKDQRGIIDIKNRPPMINLRQGLEHFFEENTHGVLQTSTLCLPIWEDTAEGKCYLFDAKPRGPNGLGYEDNGVACIVSFANAKVMYDHILNLLDDPELRQGEFVLTPVDIIIGDPKTRKKVRTRRKVPALWPICTERKKKECEERRKRMRAHMEFIRKRRIERAKLMMGRANYHELPHDVAILRGMRSQGSEYYSPNSRNKQDLTNCIVAYVVSRLQPINSWHHRHIDLILDVGEQLYIDSYITYAPKDPLLGLKNVLRKFYLGDVQVRIGIFKPLITAKFLLTNLVVAFTNLFQQENFGLLNACEKFVAVFFKAGYYYIFYPRDTDMAGVKALIGTGWAVCVRYPTINDLCSSALFNMVDSPSDPIGDFQITTLFIKEVKKAKDKSGGWIEEGDDDGGLSRRRKS